MKSVKHKERRKKQYISPKLTVHGDLRAITQATGSGAYLDADFTALTHRDDLGWTSG
jgi:hypothetical protein